MLFLSGWNRQEGDIRSISVAIRKNKIIPHEPVLNLTLNSSMNNTSIEMFFLQFNEGGIFVDKLVEILNKCGVEEYDVAEMIYYYLCEYGEDSDCGLIAAIYQGFLND